jgi:hypothetical protein
MADKLDWMNKHLVLLRYLTVSEAEEKENYRIRPDLADLFTGVNAAEEMIFKLAGLKNYKDACELLAYVTHRRAAIWWGYRCVLSLLEELKVKPPEDRDIADIGTNFTPTVPDWAKVDLPPPETGAVLDQMRAQNLQRYKELEAVLDPEIHELVQDAVDIAFRRFKQVHGIHPVDLLKLAGTHINDDPYPIDPKSPVFVEAEKLKAQLQGIQKETVDTIKSVLPPKSPEHEKKVRDNALDAVYRWVAAPDNMNSQKCLDVGNECPDTPAGLLSLSSFWAYGNLMPTGDQVVPAPPGLGANGVTQTLLMCALHKGGTRKLKERYEHYFNLGVAVFSGADNWDESLVVGTPPHREITGQASAGNGPSAAGNGRVPPPNNDDAAYKRWKPNIPGT